MIDYRRIRNDLLALGLLAVTVFLTFSFCSYDPADPPSHSVYPARAEARNLCGPTGARVAHELRLSLGLGGFLLIATLGSLDLQLFSRITEARWQQSIAGILLAVAGICIGLQTLSPSLGNTEVTGSGGYLGAWGALLLERHFTSTGIAILAVSACASGLVLCTDTRVVSLLWKIIRLPLLGTAAFQELTREWRTRRETARALKQQAREERQARKEAEAQERAARKQAARLRKTAAALANSAAQTACEEANDSELSTTDPDEPLPEPAPGPSAEDAVDDATESEDPEAREFRVNPPVVATKSNRDEIKESLERGSADQFADYELPELDLLAEAEEFPYEVLARKAQVAAATLERTFKEFGLNIRVSEIDTGPVITQFELELEAGLRLSKVTALADDLAIALRVPAVRVVAPIPGKNTVGIEVPNERQVMVRLKELIESTPEEFEKKRIPLYLGKDVSGHPLVVDMTKMPHLLIAGRTGTGKSVCLNTLILSILMTRKPDDVKMLMIDPKMVELSPYRRVPHLMHPVITDMKKAEAVLGWAVDKMEERYDLLARCRVRHLDSYNKLGKEEVVRRLGIDPYDDEEVEQIPEKMPYIVIIADEMADMMMTSGKDVEGHIIRLAQKSRAVGIHLVLATQKPTVDVITGLIKSNLPARISFQVASRTDSRVVLDEMGAERLLGNGDMLYLAPGTSNLTRAQGTYVSDDEINGIIDFFGDQEPEYNIELSRLSSSTSATSGEPDPERLQDKLYDQAIEIVIREGRGSVSLLQRCLGIGYGRAARLIDYMAEDGIVGDYNGSQAREVLYTMEQWESLRDGGVLEPAD